MQKSSPEELKTALQKCANEPIHHLGFIQPQGALLVFGDDPDRTVLQASQNLTEFLDVSSNSPTDRPLMDLLGVRAAETIGGLADQADVWHTPTAKVILHKRGRYVHVTARVFKSDRLRGVELIPIAADSPNEMRLIYKLQQVLHRLEDDPEVQGYMEGLAELIHQELNFDRVMIYRFDSNWDGDVIAESKLESLPSYLHMHFPASDIPPQARKLYEQNRIRMYADVDSQPVPLIPAINPLTAAPLDLSSAMLRSFSPVHVEYLRNIQARASMSISLLQNGRLWGLIACHKMQPMSLAFSIQDAGELISQIASSRLTYAESKARHALGNRVITIVGEALRRISAENVDDVLRGMAPALSNALDASGLIIVIDGNVVAFGETPSPPDVTALLQWLGAQPAAESFECENLSGHFPHSEAYVRLASGMIAAPISPDMRNCMIWLRPERLKTVRWGGDPNKILTTDADGSARLSPRKSFDAWMESWRGRSLPWTLAEIETARILARALIEGLSQKKRLEIATAKERESENRFRTLFEETYQPTILLEDGVMIAVNRAALRILHAESLDQVIHHSLEDISPENQSDGRGSREAMAEHVAQLLAQGSIEFEWEHLRLDREIFIAKVLMTAIREGGKDVIHVVWNDITEQKRAQRRLEYLAYYDALTGLPNRSWVTDRIAREVADTSRARPDFAVIYLDIDHFKYVNDTHGLEYGDNLLQQVAIRLENALGDRAPLCRLAADEFVVLLFDARSVGRIDEICELVGKSLQKPFKVKENDLFLTVSIGVSVYPRDGGDGAMLMRNADIALHEAKRFGQASTKFFEKRMRDSLGRYVEMRDALRLGLERREFELHYQPQVCLRTGDVNCVEALVRWNMPGRGLVMPGEFIDVAEESGLIVPLGHWILLEACRQAKIWQSWRGRPLSVAVNLSAVQFRQGDIEDDILAALHRSKLDPRQLELEITESLLLQEDHEIIGKLRSLRERGVRLSIDDFGTGYSSLAYLKQFHVDKLKIDRSFVCDLMSSESDRSIVKAMIELAHSLGISTVAEGVEDGAIVDELKTMGCDEVQGYFFSRPLSAADLQHWVTGRRL